MRTSQDLVHELEVGAGRKVFSVGLACLLVLGILVAYNFRGFKNMSAPEAMDQAQLARNISEGKGYTTSFIRPFSMYLLKRHAEENPASTPQTAAEKTGIQDRHPDISNPPVYPALLAVIMKALPFHFVIPQKPSPFFSARFQPDYLIAVINQLIFFATIGLVFVLARRLFDLPVAILGSILMYCSDLLWRFSVSGLSTTFLIFLFVALAWCLVLIEEQAREIGGSATYIHLLAAIAGLILGIGGLTRYSFAFLVFPVLVFFILFGGQFRWKAAPVALGVFMIVFTPWVIRNYHVSGTPFGTSGYSMFMPSNGIERSLNPPDWGKLAPSFYTRKLVANTRQILLSELPRLGGTWLSAFFLVGLFIRYPMPSVTRLRYFLLFCFPVIIIAQALGKTYLSTPNNDIHSENLLVLLVPLVMIYGVSLFYLLLEQLDLPGRAVRYSVIGGMGALFSLPFILTLLSAGSSPVSEPYRPDQIQHVAEFVRKKELCMSDMPWAVAWYGDRSSIWMTMNPSSEFLEIHDNQKEIRALYLTSISMDSSYLSSWVQSGGNYWGQLLLQARGLANQVNARWPQYFKFEFRLLSGATTAFPLHIFQFSLSGNDNNTLDYILLTSSVKPVSDP